ncbi:MAG TPA: hypothetical protein VM261_06255 [Kofleriaceae bacterium]|nr:hypothetical protein [Kofleriaceae bacterium]
MRGLRGANRDHPLVDAWGRAQRLDARAPVGRTHNGTLVNGEPVTGGPVPSKARDTVAFGQVSFYFLADATKLPAAELDPRAAATLPTTSPSSRAPTTSRRSCARTPAAAGASREAGRAQAAGGAGYRLRVIPILRTA